MKPSGAKALAIAAETPAARRGLGWCAATAGRRSDPRRGPRRSSAATAARYLRSVLPAGDSDAGIARERAGESAGPARMGFGRGRRRLHRRRRLYRRRLGSGPVPAPFGCGL